MRSAVRVRRLFDAVNRSSKQITRSSSVWTADGVITSPYDSIEIPNCTVYDYVWENLEKWPQKTMAVCSETGRGYSYEQAFNLSNAFAANLRTKLKIRDGDTVSVMLPNVPDFPLIALGILGAGGVISTINPVYTAQTHQDNVLAVLPFFHIYGASSIMFHKMSIGAKIITMAKFHPDNYLKCLEKHKIDLVFTAPPMILLMGTHPAGTSDTYKFFKSVTTGAAPLSSKDVERFIMKVKRKFDFRQAYGLTETSPLALMPPVGINDYQTVGYPVSNTEAKIVDEKLKDVGPNKPGELLLRGPQVMKGYRDNPQANSEVFTSDGWFKTADMSVADEKGQITITDRLKELIKVKGYQVPPAELEAVLREHPAILDAAVIGIPHAIKGEVPKAFVVIKPGQNAEAKEIKDFVREKVAPFKKIDDIEFLDAIPKSSSGKILRKDLKAKYA